MAARFEALTKDTEHKCDGGSKCPLKEQIQELYNRVCSTMRDIQDVKYEPDVQDPCGQGEGEASDSPIKTLAVSDFEGE
ncbi:hypothetical protein EsDP_00004859 [Epichloe bromicola]|uniref:Uncharacterized protein n=1 Tax=Epichloe bromicola TaxID=79588 RepID=A0ABQ0CSY4_9HYPO